MKRVIKKLWYITTYPLSIPSKISRWFWHYVSRRVSKIEEYESIKQQIVIRELRARLMRVESKKEELEAQRRDLQMQLEMEIMDKYIS